MEEVFEFLKKCGTFYIVTEDGDKPGVRSFDVVNIFEGKLYIQTGKSKNVSKQIYFEKAKATFCSFTEIPRVVEF